MAYHRYYKVDTRIVRIFNTYGPTMQLNDGRVVPNFMKQALQGERAHRIWRWQPDPQLLLRQRRDRRLLATVEIRRAFPGKHRESERVHHSGMRQTLLAITGSKSKIRHEAVAGGRS